MANLTRFERAAKDGLLVKYTLGKGKGKTYYRIYKTIRNRDMVIQSNQLINTNIKIRIMTLEVWRQEKIGTPCQV